MRIEGLRSVTVQEAQNYAKEGYKAEVNTAGQRILTKKFEGSEKFGLILLTLAKTFFTLGMLPIFSEKTQDQWRALFSGRISVIPDPEFFKTDLGKTISKTHGKGIQLGGSDKAKGPNGKVLGNDLAKPHYLLYAEQRENGKQLNPGEQALLDIFLKSNLTNWVNLLDNNLPIDLPPNTASTNIEELAKRIKERIQFLRKEIPDFDKKLAEREKPIPLLTMADIELPLESSIVKTVLLSDKEIASLKSKDLKALNSKQAEVIQKRIAQATADFQRSIQDVCFKDESKLFEPNFFANEFMLADLLSLTPEGLKKFAESIDPIFFSFIPLHTLAAFIHDYDFKSLRLETAEGLEKLRRMFTEPENEDDLDGFIEIVEDLTPQQLLTISASCPVLPDALLHYASFEDVDFKQKELRKRFDDFFPSNGYYDNTSRIYELSNDQINDLWDLFDAPRMSCLDFDQIAQLDFSNFKETDPKDEERFKGLVLPQDNSEVTVSDAAKIIQDYIIPNKDKLHPKFKKMILDNETLSTAIEELKEALSS